MNKNARRATGAAWAWAGRRSAALALAAGAALWGAGAAAQTVPVVASFSILGDMVREVGGDNVSVTTLVGPDGDAHTYEPTPGNARELARARLLVVNGIDFETWLPRLTQAAGFKGQTVVAAEGVKVRRFEGGDEHDGDHDHDHDDHDHDHDHDHKHDHDHDHDHKHDHDHGAKAGADKHEHKHDDAHKHGAHHHVLDPHAWQDLRNAVIYVRNIERGLAAVDPAHAQAYRQRADAYVARIEALDAKTRATLGAIDPARRKIVSSHDAFGYFGDAYGVTFIPVEGLSTQSEPSAADVARIIAQVRKEQVPALFVENISSPRLVEQIARETGAKVGGTLYSDALSQPGQPGATYLGMFEWNVDQLAAALRR
ncbi:metal ABC transporter substrate-binding protein [Bordetella genomosp. 5]|uniref:metal ABC transporter substrate-binding protein n=1 Tax=Bordetella genomosp. 5 TaxID=1395608 RepID=UPI000B9E7857|nr:metal ABC transporter substrate-binding protein [Bordetella genomosp. 5]OZI33514.1 metal ABC transporter substrate-binding protein [Bordetella genomosp. 5]